MRQIQGSRIVLLILCSFLLMNIQTAAQESEALQQFQYANKLMEDSLFDLSADQFEEFLKLYSDSPRAPEAMFLLGSVRQKMGEWQQSISSFQRLLTQYPDFSRNDEATFAIADNYWKLQETDKAIRLLERISLFYPQSPYAARAYFTAGRFSLDQGDIHRAEQDWLRLLQDYARSGMVPDTRLQLAKLYMQKKDHTAAQAQIDRVLENSPDGILFVKVGLLKAKLLADQYKLDTASQLYNQLLKTKVSPEWQIRIKYDYADFLCQTGDNKKARQILEPILTYQSSSIQDSLVSVWVKANFNENNDDAILSALNKYSFSNSLLQAKTYQMGIQAAIRASDHESAIQLLEQCIALIRNDSLQIHYLQQNQLQLIRQYRMVNRTADALSLAQSILDEKTGNWNFNDQVRYLLAKIYQKDLNQPRQALFYYEQILAPTHKSSLADEAALGMALCYKILGNDQQAQQIYKNFANTFPGSPLLKQVLDNIRWNELYLPENNQNEMGQSSLLLSSLLLEDNKEEALFSLTKQMFDKIKDYPRVIKLIHLIEQKDLLADRSEEVDRMLGYSYYRMALAQDDETVKNRQLDSARTALLKYISAISNKNEQGKVALVVHEIDLQTKGRTTMDFLSEYDFLAKMVSRFQDEPIGRQVQFRLAQLLQDYGVRTTKDSIRSALRYYNQILNDSTSSYRENADQKISLDVSSTTIPVEEQALYYQAEACFELGDTVQALSSWQEYRNRFPRGFFIISVMSHLGDIANERDLNLAEQIYSDMHQRYYFAPIADSVQIILAQIKLKLGKYPEAEKLLIPLQDTENGLYLLGQAYQKQNQWLKARTVFNRYLNQYPDGKYVADVYWSLAEMARQANQQQEAAFYREKFLQRFPDDAKSLQVKTIQADQLYTDGNYKQALDIYSSLAANNPGDASLQTRKTVCLVRMGNISAAQLALKKFEDQFDEDKEDVARVKYEIGNYYLEQKHFESAEKIFKNVQSDYKKTEYAAFAEFALGKLNIMTNHTDEGLEILTKLVGKYTDHEVLSKAYLTLGDFYYKTKQFENALSSFKKILTLNPPQSLDLTARRYLIKIYSDLGIYDSALIALRQYLERYPDEPDTFENRIQLGITLINLNEYSRAIEHLRSLLSRANNDEEAEIRYWIGKSYFRMGQFRTAISEYLKVPYLTKPTKLPWHVTAEYESGLAYMKLEEWDRAREIFNNIVKKEGGTSDFGRVALRKLEEIDQMQ